MHNFIDISHPQEAQEVKDAQVVQKDRLKLTRKEEEAYKKNKMKKEHVILLMYAN